MHKADDVNGQVPANAGETFAERWSRRKHAAAQARTVAPPADAPRDAPAPPSMTDADMPAISLLTADSDLSAFFSPGVSEGLRRQALRKVFQQARFNVVDGLDDYAGDYTSYRPLGDLVTAGLRWHRQRIAARAREACDTDAGAERGPGETTDPCGDAEDGVTA